MKLVKKSILAIACGGSLLVGGNAFAINLNITATVTPTCAFKQVGYDMTFDEINPSLSVNMVAPVDITYYCTRGTTPATFTVNGKPSGSSVDITNPATKIPLSVGLTWTTPLAAGSGFTAGAVQKVTVTGTILAADRLSAFAGTYSGHFALVISP